MSNRIKLLIVDDEVQFLDSIARRLELRDFEVTKAGNGQQAVEAARGAKFDLALLDLKMPGMDGQQVLEILKREHKYLEIIILTGHGSLDSAVECAKLGAYKYLPKPYELDELLEVLRAAYQARLSRKFEADESRMEQLRQLAVGQSALGILRALRELDDEEK
jgi:DNA-binding NtrC family response regulator